MADNDQKRRFLRNHRRSTPEPKPTNPPASDTPAGAGVQAVPQTRPATAQASQDVVDLVGFLREAENRRAQGQPVPTPKGMKDVLGAFRGQPAHQTTIQVLAAAATTRHLGAPTRNTRKWEQLAQKNAERLQALRAQQYRQEQERYVQVQTPPDEIQRRITEREAADRDNDKRAFDAAAALALSYVAAKSVPSFDKLAELAEQHLTIDERTTEVSESVTEIFTRVADDPITFTETADHMNIDGPTAIPQTPGDTDLQARPDVTLEKSEDADASDRIEHVAGSAPKAHADLVKLGNVLESAGRGLATAVGAINGDDEIAPPLSPVDLNRLSQELLYAIGAAMSGHPRSMTEMLNIESRSDQSNEATFVPDLSVKHRQEELLEY